MRSVQTARGVYVAARARTIRRVCQTVRQSGQTLGTLAALIAHADPNPWVQALSPLTP